MRMQTPQRPKGRENGWGWGPYWQSAMGCAFKAARRKNVLKLPLSAIRREAEKRAHAWVARRPWLTERERARSLMDFAEMFNTQALDYISERAAEIGDHVRSKAALRLEFHQLYS